MLKLLASIILVVTMTLYATVQAQQETTPLKTFEYTIKISHLKLESQATNAVIELYKFNKIQNPDIKFLDYTLTFKCTNHALERSPVLEQIKAILTKNGIEIDQVERKLIKS